MFISLTPLLSPIALWATEFIQFPSNSAPARVEETMPAPLQTTDSRILILSHVKPFAPTARLLSGFLAPL